MKKIRQIISSVYRFFFPISLVEMYRKMGVMIGDNCQFQFGVTLDYSHHWLIHIGNNVILAPKVHVLAHDASTKMHLGYSKIANVYIEDNVFIGANTTVLPGVRVGKNSIVGAGSVVSKSIAENMVAAGSPAREICTLEEFLEKQRATMKRSPVYDKKWTQPMITLQMKKKMVEELKASKWGFVE